MTDNKDMKIFKQKFTTILLAVAFLVGALSTVNFALKTEAATLNTGSFTINTPSDPLFSDLNIAPGYLNAKTIQVTNHDASAKDFSIALSSLSGDLKNVLKIKAEVGGEVKFDEILTSIAVYPNNEFVTSVPGGNQTVNIIFTAYLPTEVGNDYQAKSVAFDFVMGGSTIEYPTPGVIPIVTPPVVTSTSGTGSTDSTGASTSTYSPISRTARGLSQATSGGTAVGPEIPAPSPTVEQPKETGQVAGETTETKGEETSGKIVCFWWWVLSIVYALLLLIYGWIFYKRELMFDWAWPILGGTVLYFLHWYLHNFYTPSKWCPYFVWFELAILILYYIIYSYYKNRAEEEGEEKK